MTGVAATNATGPTHVELTEGLAVRDGEAWRYVCPASWGSAPLSPSAAGLDDEEVFLPGTGGLFAVDAEGRATPTGGGPAIHALLGLAHGEDAVVALATGETALRTVWDVAADGVTLLAAADPRVVDCLDARGGEAWACADGVLHPLAEDGTLGDSEWRTWAGDAGVDPGSDPEESPPLELVDKGCGCNTDSGAAMAPFLVPLLFWRRRWSALSPSSCC